MREFSVVIERDSEGFYVASVPAGKGCHSPAKSLDNLIERVREVIKLCLEVQEASGDQLDEVQIGFSSGIAEEKTRKTVG
jgi:predicted RNase H-like HicB family nuclease